MPTAVPATLIGSVIEAYTVSYYESGQMHQVSVSNFS